MIGSQVYPEGSRNPHRVDAGVWHVWCHTGALEALRQKGYVRELDENPETGYRVNFANGSAARINPRHPLWHELLKIISAGYFVHVFELALNGRYVPWTGDPKQSLRHFDCILIMATDAPLPRRELRGHLLN